MPFLSSRSGRSLSLGLGQPCMFPERAGDCGFFITLGDFSDGSEHKPFDKDRDSSMG